MKIVTGYTGKPHVTSMQEASENMGVAGGEDYVLSVGNKLKAEIVTNNSIKILDGDLMMQGHHALIEADNYEEVTINNGTQGMKRNDLIVARYTKDSISGVEDIQIVVVEGTPGAQGTDPVIVTSDIRSGGLRHEMPLYRVELDGLNIVKLTGVFQVLRSVAEVNSSLAPKLLWSGEASAPNSTITINSGMGAFTDYAFLIVNCSCAGTVTQIIDTSVLAYANIRTTNLPDAAGSLNVGIYEVSLTANSQGTVLTIHHNSATTKSAAGTWSRIDSGPAIIQKIYGIYHK